MPTIELDAATIDYVDSGGTGPCLVLLHGVLMYATVWDKVISHLGDGFRCVAPTLPLGAHRHPVPPETALDNEALTHMVVDLMDRLDLHDVTLAPQQLERRPDHHRARPGSPRRALGADRLRGPRQRPTRRAGRTPGPARRHTWGLALQAWLARLPAVRSSVASWMAKHSVPDATLQQWFTPLRDPRIRRDLRRFCATLPRQAGRNWSTGLAHFDRPALVVWAPEDRMMPTTHGQHLAELLPQGELVQIHDAYTLIPLDQPQQLAKHLRRFGTRKHRRDGHPDHKRDSHHE